MTAAELHRTGLYENADSLARRCIATALQVQIGSSDQAHLNILDVKRSCPASATALCAFARLTSVHCTTFCCLQTLTLQQDPVGWCATSALQVLQTCPPSSAKGNLQSSSKTALSMLASSNRCLGDSSCSTLCSVTQLHVRPAALQRGTGQGLRRSDRRRCHVVSGLRWGGASPAGELSQLSRTPTRC